MSVDRVDHTRGLCGKPNVSDNTPREVVEKIVEKKAARCLCCGTAMYIQDPVSIGMQQLGVYLLVCPSCPSPRAA
ncbi:MAG: hypothetical protein AAB627_00945 [Patescibacteria group bacterium]